jgi:PAT family acetyl-CoA transporter-like MFS transporter 1
MASNRKSRETMPQFEDLEAANPGTNEKSSKQPGHMPYLVKFQKLQSDLQGDLQSILLLFLLYTLQGVPMGLASSIPLLLQERCVTYSEQSMFSLVSWPVSLKLLWAPVVDSIYFPAFGRRKSWLIPVQFLCGIMMIAAAPEINVMLGDDTRKPDVIRMTLFFFALYFLMATQDIAVDGWAITMLSRRNVGWASTCNAVGQALGNVVSFILFMSLNSAEVRLV